MTATRLTLAVGSLVSLLACSCCDALGVQRLHEAGGYIRTTTARASNRAIFHENCSRRESRQLDKELPILSEIYRVRVGRKEARDWKTVETKRTVQRNEPFYAVFRKTLSLCNANGMDRF